MIQKKKVVGGKSFCNSIQDRDSCRNGDEKFSFVIGFMMFEFLYVH